MTKDREICEAATPGPWEAHKDLIRYKHHNADEGNDGLWYAELACRDDAAYIAHFHPEYQAKLLDVVDAGDVFFAALESGRGYAMELVALKKAHAALAALDADGAGEDGR